jgi:hypothetical protein
MLKFASKRKLIADVQLLHRCPAALRLHLGNYGPFDCFVPMRAVLQLGASIAHRQAPAQRANDCPTPNNSSISAPPGMTRPLADHNVIAVTVFQQLSTRELRPQKQRGLGRTTDNSLNFNIFVYLRQ